ncbi:MAG: 23S rRNA (uracil(1939)-C(5))-methyltransferase RlmD [Bacilli bacterium]
MRRSLLKKGDIVFGKAVNYTFDGLAILRTENGESIFVPSLNKSESADVRVEYVSRKANYGRIVKLHTFAPERIEPRCPIATACGGCQFQNLAYPAQLEFKKQKVKDAFHNIAHIDPEVANVIGMKEPYFYRNKTQMPFGFEKKGKIVSGFYRAKTHDIIPVKQCYIENDKAGPVIHTIRELMIKYQIPPYDEDAHTGFLRHVLIRTSYHFSHLMVVLVTVKEFIPNLNSFLEALLEEHKEITTITQNINKDQTNVILGLKDKVLFGPGYIKDKIAKVEFRISPKSFFQINPLQTEKLYQTIIDLAEFNGNERVLDAYSGIGSIGLVISSYVREVIGVESVKVAVKDAEMNAKRNKIKNARFYEGDAGDFLENAAKTGQRFDVVILDPPRRGASQKFIKSLLRVLPSKIIYVSCDPATMARDIALLKNHYEVGTLHPVDMFPFTHHVETCALLKKKCESF